MGLSTNSADHSWGVGILQVHLADGLKDEGVRLSGRFLNEISAVLNSDDKNLIKCLNLNKIRAQYGTFVAMTIHYGGAYGLLIRASSSSKDDLHQKTRRLKAAVFAQSHVSIDAKSAQLGCLVTFTSYAQLMACHALVWAPLYLFGIDNNLPKRVRLP